MDEAQVHLEISNFGFEMQDLSNFEIFHPSSVKYVDALVEKTLRRGGF